MLSWHNNQFVDEDDIRIGVKTHGLHYSTSVFEGIRVYDGKIFAAEAHAERLINSAKIAGIPFEYSSSDIVEAMKDLVDRTGLKDAYIRPLAWKGDESLGIYAPNNSVHVAIVIYEWPNVFGAESKKKGISLTTNVPYKRPNPACAPVQAKASSMYLTGVLNREAAERQHFNDSLMGDYRGKIAEASGANVFLEKDGKLYTPVPESFLNGITRQVVMALAKEQGISVQETDIDFDELENFKHIFLTGTAYEVMPVNRVDSKLFEVGGLTRIFQAEYENLTHQKSRVICKDGYATIERNLDLGS